MSIEVSHKHCLRARRNMPCLIKAVRVLNYPTTGTLAMLIWHLLSGPYYFSSYMSAKLYIKLGYRPFEGYPLIRLERFR